MSLEAAFTVLEPLTCFAMKTNDNLTTLGTFAASGCTSMWFPGKSCNLPIAR